MTAEAAPKPITKPSGRILVLAKSLEAGELVRTVLAGAGFPVDVADPGDSFSRQAASDPSLLVAVQEGLVLEDFGRAAEAVRARPEGQDLPVILVVPKGGAVSGGSPLTGYPQPFDRAIVLEGPPPAETLLSVVRAVLSTRQRLASLRTIERDLRQSESALGQADERLSETDRRLEEFLAMLAHELRDPLTPIRNAVQVLKMTSPKDPLLERQHDVIDRQVTHMARVLDDLLDSSRFARGLMSLEIQPVFLRDVLKRAVEVVSPLIEGGRRVVVRDTVGSLRVRGDFDRLVQVVGNLLNNAARHTPKGGEIFLEGAREGDQALVRVRDNGSGIEPEKLTTIFEGFSPSAGAAAGSSPDSLGLELALARNLTHLHGGTIEAHSEGPGKGSEFVVRLPLAPNDEAGPSQRPAAADEETRKAGVHRILVVDDMIDTTDSLSMLLRMLGHDVRSAYDGMTALKMLREFRPDMVILDIGMPGMDGYDVARVMRRDQSGQGIKIVAMTGFGQEEDRKKAAEAGFDRHVTKPVDLRTLKKLLSELKPASSRPS